MSDTPFKTPLPYTPIHHDYDANVGDTSDSGESTTSTGESGSCYNINSADLSIVADFDDLMRLVRHRRQDKIEDAFQAFAEDVKGMWGHWHESVMECRRLQQMLDKRTSECSELENHLKIARKLLDKEKLSTRQAEKERDYLEAQISSIQDIFNQKDNRLPNETREKLEFLNIIKGKGHEGHPTVGNLSAIQEINSTGSILSDFSYSRSEDDLNDTTSCPTWKKHRASMDGVAQPSSKRLKSSTNRVVEVNATDTVRATTTLTVTKEGPITATSVIESVPKAPEPSASSQASAPPANLVFESWARESPRKQEKSQYRQHVLQQKTVVMPDTCGPCEKRIRFGKTCLKCKDCRILCHLECKEKLPIACVPLSGTPNQRNMMGIISDYTPTTAPMVPAILIHCINEIELRGLVELGLYRIPGAERDVKMLKEKFLKGKGVPCLNQVDVHVICGTVKDFLRSLGEPIVTHALWRSFVAAVEVRDPQDTVPALYQVVSELPQPNRDTLAYMVLHLQKISEIRKCKMPVSNLAKIFGPTIVGYSTDNIDPANLLCETRQQVQVMEALLNIPSEYWSTFVNVSPPASSNLRQTPSTDSLLRSTGVFTPNRKIMPKRKQRFFATPPRIL